MKLSIKPQTLKTLISELQLLYKCHGDLPVIYAKDDEGNSYDAVLFKPTVFLERTELENVALGVDKAVCIN